MEANDVDKHGYRDVNRYAVLSTDRACRPRGQQTRPHRPQTWPDISTADNILLSRLAVSAPETAAQTARVPCSAL